MYFRFRRLFPVVDAALALEYFHHFRVVETQVSVRISRIYQTWRDISTSGFEWPYCYFPFSVVIEMIVFELAMVDFYRAMLRRARLRLDTVIT